MYQRCKRNSHTRGAISGKTTAGGTAARANTLALVGAGARCEKERVGLGGERGAWLIRDGA